MLAKILVWVQPDLWVAWLRLYTRFCSVTELQTGVFSITSWFNNGASGPLRFPVWNPQCGYRFHYRRYHAIYGFGLVEVSVVEGVSTYGVLQVISTPRKPTFAPILVRWIKICILRMNHLVKLTSEGLKKANLVLTLETSRKFSNAFMLRFLFSAMLLELTLCKL